MAKLALDFTALNGCADLDAWVKVPKKVLATVDLRYLTPDEARSPEVDVVVEGYQAACGFKAYVERRKYGRYWLVFSMKHGSKREEFFMVGSHHVNKPSPPYLDLCCGAQVLHLHPYEKRRAHTCKQTWGRRSRNGIDQSNSAAFYEEAARAINLTLPTPALVETHPSQPLLGGP